MSWALAALAVARQDARAARAVARAGQAVGNAVAFSLVNAEA
ncbi:hypothetical protein [Paracoccus hibiscisoli]|nr:hypothetical protein [Paracoccus hibiscisoli]